MKVVLWDMDSTLCNTLHRQLRVVEFRKARKRGDYADPAEQQAFWDDYSMRCIDDAPVPGAVALARLLSRVLHVEGSSIRQFGVSGRGQCAIGHTWDWLKKHDVPLDDVILRANDVPNGDFKVGVIQKMQEQGNEVLLYIEDWRDTADQIMKQTGVPVLVVSGDYLEESGSNV